jgi:hypothetical protein
MMETATRDYPAGDLRVSDADRDRALTELSAAFEAGRITAGELEERSGRALGARTGSELTGVLTDLPGGRLGSGPANVQRSQRILAARVLAGASGAGAVAMAALAAANASGDGSDGLQKRELAREVLTRLGLSVPVPAAPGFDWPGTVIPGAIALVLVVTIVVLLRAARAGRS